MKPSMRHISAQILVTALLALAAPARGQQDPETAKAMAEVVKIAHAISIVQPHLEEPKYIEYAMGIYRASKKYEIRPALIIAIAQQESSFQERLPEGKAGELGITQVLKSWLKNPRFRAEFPEATRSSLRRPANSFQYTAWILHELKQNETPGTLPFWSFYNARQFKHRIKYFVQVNKHMGKLKRNLHIIEEALGPDSGARPMPSEGTLAFADKPLKKTKPSTSTKRALAKVDSPKPISTYRWIETMPAPKTKAPAKKDPREALIRSASLGG